jgi:cell division protein FtsB
VENVKSILDLTKEYGFGGAVTLGALALWAAVTKRWIVLPAMADLQAENARLKAENEFLKSQLEGVGK